MKNVLSNARAAGSAPRAHPSADAPLDLLDEDHLRVRTICETLDRIAGADRPERSDIFAAAAFLETDLPLMLKDEDDDLLVLLRSHVDAKDGAMLDRVAQAHAALMEAIGPIASALAAMRKTRDAPTKAERARMTKLATMLREGMILENARLMPLARGNLTAKDLAVLQARRVQRRMDDMRAHRSPAK